MPGDKFYSSNDWRKLRTRVRADWILAGKPCGWCGQPIEPHMGTIVDHVIPRKQRPDLALRISNLQLLHHRCHNIKTHSTERTNKVQVNDDGLPSDGSWG
jgi:Restriction endonuclease